MLASEETVDFAAIQEAYAAARFAAEALRTGAPPKAVRDLNRDEFEDAMATLRPLAKISDHNDHAPEQTTDNSPGEVGD